ncbi:HAMP domain-containing histidine kinase [Oscillibacter sp. MSJ-2]|uniref:histidine kinase n=1 Tax=Dysosmobacter acutus TaxID=2841504 RepID=A0ABS6FBI2_9FIRM|nr:HAMP domain-containing sensor histidine kinase [Dysosmobacter acutus]MBU5627632.1 HAMP domain-containing histidine kinase [Dysosmobacter acutus]
MDKALLFAAAGAILAAAAVMIYDRLRLRRTLSEMDRMLSQAMDGSFIERDFDESRLSAVETKLAHYLTASAVSARNLYSEKDKIKSMISDISHQTKTPIANILLYAQLLCEQELNAEGRDCVKALTAQAEKLRFLIDALVKVSRLETGILTLRPVPGPILPTVERSLAQAAPKARARGIELTLHPSEDTACFDPKWTAEALYNLLDNAVKYTAPGGAVTVRLTSYPLFCRVDVADTGMGISEEELPKVFGRFYRSSAASGVEGTGLGLYLARQIAQGQGGYIKACSAPGKGSVFSLFLPRDP